MSETDDSGTRSRAGGTGGKTLSLKRTETSTVRQSFSHGRSKAVVVEKKRARVLPGGKPLEPEKPSKHGLAEDHTTPEARDTDTRRPTGARGGVVLRELTEDEKEVGVAMVEVGETSADAVWIRFEDSKKSDWVMGGEQQG